MKLCTSLAYALLLCSLAPAQAEIVIHMKDGTAHRVPVDVNQVTSIEFGSMQPSSRPAPTPRPTSTSSSTATATATATSAGTYHESVATYMGGWQKITQQQLEGGSAMRTTQAGASATFTFRGGSIALISKTQPDAGAADVFIDGQKVLEVVQFQGEGVWEDQKVLVLKSGLNPNQDHELRIVHNGKTNPYSKPAWFTIDGFIVKP